jgi:hypothetical protein
MGLELHASVLAGGISLAFGLSACVPSPVPMRPGIPVEVRRGYCFVPTEFTQRGVTVDRDSVMKRLARNSDSAPYVSDANAIAVGSIGATIVGTTTLGLGFLGRGETVKMSDGTTTALIGTGIGVGVLSWVLCITADGQYASAVEVYNQRFRRDRSESDEDASVVREPGDDGVYRSSDSPEVPAPKKPPENRRYSR